MLCKAIHSRLVHSATQDGGERWRGDVNTNRSLTNKLGPPEGRHKEPPRFKSKFGGGNSGALCSVVANLDQVYVWEL